MLRMIAQTLVLSGEAYLIIRRGRRTGRVAELWPVEPSRVSRVWADGSLFYDVSPGAVGEPERLTPADVVRIYRPRPDDLMEAYGTAALVWDEVLAEQGWSQSVRKWFTNDARPSTVLEMPEDSESWYRAEGIFEQLSRDWQARGRGARAHSSLCPSRFRPARSCASWQGSAAPRISAPPRPRCGTRSWRPSARPGSWSGSRPRRTARARRRRCGRSTSRAWRPGRS
ncbi:MAG: phage portal protein [Candidatus Eisenbacteria bacterium]|uniref:Phage portal protein n=1 Tax=Eiseniibacteriota bacterium TaxID=2212470 RepID=A0A538TYE6_UNCEI|nr:MAG: phage portal protein [Candidatus Eisenbacteria bacterium]